MKKKWSMKRFVVVLVLVSGFLFVSGCSKSGDESEDNSAKILELSRQIVPLQICRVGKKIETITLSQAMAWHESHEHEHGHGHEHDTAEEQTAGTVEEKIQTHQHHHHLCLGVVTGYQAIRYATGELFGEDVPQASDFDIKVSGSMDGVWDVMSFYTGRELEFEGEPKELDLESFTFTAKRISKDKSIIFRIRRGLIPDEFFVLKNQGATCSSSELRTVKKQALLNILSADAKGCFESLRSVL